MGFSIGTPACINDMDEPQTVAIDDEPFDSVISETILNCIRKFFFVGNDVLIALQASLP